MLPTTLRSSRTHPLVINSQQTVTAGVINQTGTASQTRTINPTKTEIETQQQTGTGTQMLTMEQEPPRE